MRKIDQLIFFAVSFSLVAVLLFYYLNSRSTQKTTYNLPAVKIPTHQNLETNNEFLSLSESDSLVETAAESTEIPIPEGAMEDELTLHFKDEDALNKFLSLAEEKGFEILDLISELNTVRVKTPQNQSDLTGELLGEEEIGFNFPIRLPAPPNEGGGTSTDSTPFTENLYDWLGLGEDNSSWGKDVTIAVLDTGIKEHRSLNGADINALSLIDLETNDNNINIHGTAVSSLLVGQENIRGISPAAQLINIQVLDNNGTGDSFTVAKGIIEAVKKGAKIINLSLGSSGNSSTLENAVKYAQANGAVIVASAGNDSSGNPYYPANYPGVLGVGAIDLLGESPNFTNYGDYVDLVAPGVGIKAAYEGDQIAYYDGTSFSAPYVSGALATLLSQNRSLSTQDAVSLLLENLNESGVSGKDPYYGNGILNLNRLLNYNKRGIYDAAITNYYFETGELGLTETVHINVQNQGTEWLNSVRLQVKINGSKWSIQLGNLSKGQSTTYSLKIPKELETSVGTFKIESSIESIGQQDHNKDNNTLLEEVSFNSGNQ